MSEFVETIAAVIILMLAVLLLSHLISGTATQWVKSKFIAAGES